MGCPRVRGKRQFVSLHLVSLILLGPVADHVSIAQQNFPMHLSLDQALDLAIKQNRSIHLRSLAVEDMRSKENEARSNYMPQLRASGGIHHVTELAGIEIPAGAFGKFPSTGSVPAKSLFIDQGSDTAYTGGVELDQPLTQLLRIHQSNVAADQDVLVAQTQFSQAQADVALNVRKLYYGILINQQQLQASQEQLEAMRLKDSVAQSDVEHGNALEITTLQTKASIFEAQQKSLTLKLQGEDLKRELVDVLGLPVGKQIDLDPDIPAQSIDLPSCSEATRIALERNQDIRAARHSLEKAKAELAAAKDLYIPDITGSSRYSYQSGVPLLEHNFGTFGFNLSFDIFDGGRREAQVRDARTAVMSAQVTVDKLQSEVMVEIQAEYARVKEFKEMVGVVRQTVEVRTEAARLADRQFEQNALLSAVRGQAHADLAGAAATLLEANLNLSMAQAEVKKTIGQMPR
jgi:outer membrane protein TolC